MDQRDHGYKPDDLSSASANLKDLSLSSASPLEMAGIQMYELGEWQLESGQTIPHAQMAYKTFGDPKSPAIVYPSWFSGRRSKNEHPLKLY